MEAKQYNNDIPDLFHSFFESERLPTDGLMNSDRLCEQVLRIIISGNLSFSQAENPELIALLKNAYPSCNIPNRHSISARLKSLTKEEQQKLKLALKDNDSKVSLALDAWTARGSRSAFLGISHCDGKMICYALS
jgi:hypothetical protein